MPHAVFRFPGRRYHATPWNSHVNEGLVEWPPSPWRICRALIATGFTKLGWSERVVPDSAVGLIEALAESNPIYRLPTAVTTHSRHYMPIGAGKTSKVFDTFAHVGDQALGISWHVDIEPEQLVLLERLLTHMGYLGRAESWVAAELVDESSLPDHPIACANMTGAPARTGWELVQLIAPMSAGEYADWRSTSVPDALAAGGKKLTGRRKQQIEGRYPVDLWSCLTRRTSELQRDGWSQPPGSRILLYERRRDALASAAPRSRPAARTRPRVECALLALSSNTSRGEVLPLMQRCLSQGEFLHRSLVALSARISDDACPELTGLDEGGRPLTGHRHVHYLPIDLDGDGRLDHCLLYAPMGLGDVAQRAIERLRRTWTKGGADELFVSAVGQGSRAEIGAALLGQRGDPGLVELSANWVSHTPFVAPRFIKKRKHSIDEQVRAELEERGFPAPVSVEVADRDELLASDFLKFVRQRRDASKRPPVTQPWLLRLRFAEPVPGPISIGYACHYGLGVFRPCMGT